MKHDNRETAPRSGAAIIQFPAPVCRLRADVAPFDPNNPAHIAAWESLWDAGMAYRAAADAESATMALFKASKAGRL